ncbi:MAG: hypothetical protein U0231_18075 [Nitrospiraceae bacterium]
MNKWISCILLCIGWLMGAADPGLADSPEPVLHVLVAYHSLSGQTEKMAELLMEPVESLGPKSFLKRVRR